MSVRLMRKRPLPQHLVALAALPNLGPVSAGWLHDAGIKTPAALRRLGAVEAFRRVVIHRGGYVSTNLLYAIDGALRGQRWDYLPPRVRIQLKAAANAAADSVGNRTRL